MIKIAWASLALTLAVAMSAGASTQTPQTKEVMVSVSEAYIPGGFDSNSDVYVIVSGVFPNGCYSWGEAKVENKSETLHEVTSLAEVTQGMCIMVMVPFSKEVRLGQFSKGEHVIRFVNGDGTFLEKTVVIE